MNHKLRIGALFQFGPHNLDKNIIWFKVTHRQRNLELIRTTTLKIIGLGQGNIKNPFMNRTWLSRNQVYFHVSICEGERTLTQRRARFFCKMELFLFSDFDVVSVWVLAKMERFIANISHQSSVQIDFVPAIKDWDWFNMLIQHVTF